MKRLISTLALGMILVGCASKPPEEAKPEETPAAANEVPTAKAPEGNKVKVEIPLAKGQNSIRFGNKVDLVLAVPLVPEKEEAGLITRMSQSCKISGKLKVISGKADANRILNTQMGIPLPFPKDSANWRPVITSTIATPDPKSPPVDKIKIEDLQGVYRNEATGPHPELYRNEKGYGVGFFLKEQPKNFAFEVKFDLKNGEARWNVLCHKFIQEGFSL